MDPAPAPVPAPASAPAPAPADHDHEYNPDEFDYSSEEIEPSDDEGPPTLRVKRSNDDEDTEARENPIWSKRSDDSNDSEANEGPSWSKRSNDNNDSESNEGRTWSKRSNDNNDSESNEGRTWSKRSNDNNDSESNEGPTWSKRSNDNNDTESNEGPTWSKRSNDNNDSESNEGTTWSKRSNDNNDSESNEGPTWSKRNDDNNDSESNEGPTWSKRRNDDNYIEANESPSWRKRNNDDNDDEVVGHNDFEDNNNEDGNNDLTIDDAADWGYGSENGDDETPVLFSRRHHDDGHHHHHPRCHDMNTSRVRMPTSWKRDVTITMPNMKDWKCGQDKTRLINLKPNGKVGGREYNIIVDQMNKTKRYQPRMKFNSYNIVKIQRVVNGCFWRRYKRRQEAIKTEVGYRNERMLFHGTDKVKELLEYGFDERHASMKNLFGPGLYFARHSSKGNQYVFGNFKPCPRHGDVNCDICERKMLLCRVTLGKVLKETKSDKRYNPPPGYHSVKGVPSGSFLKYDEFVVYRGEQVYPEYLITYKLVK